MFKGCFHLFVVLPQLFQVIEYLPFSESKSWWKRQRFLRYWENSIIYIFHHNFFSFFCREEEVSCYFYLLRQTSLDLEAELDGTGGSFYTSQEYVICFLSSPSSGLEIYPLQPVQLLHERLSNGQRKCLVCNVIRKKLIGKANVRLHCQQVLNLCVLKNRKRK